MLKFIELYAKKKWILLYSNLNAGVTSLVLFCSTFALFISMQTVLKEETWPIWRLLLILLNAIFMPWSLEDDKIEGARLRAQQCLRQARFWVWGQNQGKRLWEVECVKDAFRRLEERGGRLTRGLESWGRGDLGQDCVPGWGEEYAQMRGGRYRATPTFSREIRLAQKVEWAVPGVYRVCLSPIPPYGVMERVGSARGQWWPR